MLAFLPEIMHDEYGIRLMRSLSLYKYMPHSHLPYSHHHHLATPRRILAFTLSLLVFLQNSFYFFISTLPAPPPVYAEEAMPPPTGTTSATTPATDPLDNFSLDINEIFPTTSSAQPETTETIPEATSSAKPETIPEATISADLSTPTPSPSSSPTPPLNLTPTPPPPSPNSIPQVTETPTPSPTPTPTPPTFLPLPLTPLVSKIILPFSGSYPLSYHFGETSSYSFVSRMQSLFGVEAHDGIDYAMPEGTPILAVDDGVVTSAGPGTYGTTLVINHSWGSSYYGHLSQTLVTPDQTVQRGEIIAISGNTGISTAPHLHFGIRPSSPNLANGYHGFVDPSPYLTGTVLGQTTFKSHLAKYFVPSHHNLKASTPSLSLPLTTNGENLTYELTNPRGEKHQILPHLNNFGTGQTAIIPRPEPFVPGVYHLTATSPDGTYDTIDFAWGVLALNPNKSLYALGDEAKIAIAVLDPEGNMVCDASLELVITDPSGNSTTLTTQAGEIIVNQETCQSKNLTLSPDYLALYTPPLVGNYSLSLTATTIRGEFSLTNSFLVELAPEYNLERLTATRIFPGHTYPVIFRLTTPHTQHTALSEFIPSDFARSPLSPESLKSWVPNLETRAIVVEGSATSWDLELTADTPYYFGYEYDAPDVSPAFYTLGPAVIGTWSETRTWQLAVDAVDRYVGFFSPPNTWTVGQDTDVVLRQPDPRQNDLMIASIAIRPSSATIATPTGWTLLESNTATDGGGEGSDTGSVGFYWFYKVAAGTEGTNNETFYKTGTASVWTGQIMQVRSGTGTYDITADSLLFNGDATAWSGQLSTDIGLLDGDLVLLGAAQNGNLSGTGTWNITATNVVTKSTVNEHGEFTTATGNQVEVGLAATQIWQGNNTDNPTITVTQSTAVSGVYTAVRVRQGSGTVRSDTWVRSAGKQATGTTTVAPSYPEHDINDLLLLIVGSRASTEPTPTTPTNWTYLDSYSGGAGSQGTDSGPARITVFYRQASALYTSTQTVSISGGNTAIGQILAIHKDDLGSWSLDSTGGSDTSAGTDWSVTGSSIALDSASGGDIVLAGSAINTDQLTGYTAHSLSATGDVTFGDVTQTGEFITSGGNDMGFDIATGRVNGGSGTVDTTFQMTASGTLNNYPAGSSIFVKVSGTTQATTSSVMGFFSPEGLWTAAANDATLTLIQPDPRVGDLMVATVAIRPSTSSVDTPEGWTSLGSWTGTDSGIEGTDTGSVRLHWFYKVAGESEPTTQGFTETGTTSVFMGSIMQVRSATGTYSLSAGGYSIDGDTTNWGGTLDTDIGLTGGDLVLIAAAQNGNTGAASAWDINATGITEKGTVNEHGEFTSGTGNDVEIDLASTMIWEGTNSTTPTVALTMGSASGAVTAVRIRKGSGTERTDTFVRSAGPQAIGSTTVAVPYPEHEVGDMLVLLVGSRHASDLTPLTPSDWTYLGTYNGGAGSFGADAGNARITAFYREVTARRYNTQTVTLGAGTNHTMTGEIIALHKKNASTWNFDSDGGADSTGDIDWEVDGTGGIDLSSGNGGDIILVGSSTNTDLYTFTSHNLVSTGTVGFGDVTQTTEYRSGTGNDMDLVVSTGRVTSGGGTGETLTFGMTSNATATNRPAGSSMFIAVSGSTGNSAPATPSLDSPSDTATNQSATPALKTTTTDTDSDYLRYKIQVCDDSNMTTNCSTFDQTSSQTGWSGQDTESNSAYASGTQATYTLQSTLNYSQTYYWRSYAIDPAGSNTWSSTQGSPYSFTTIEQPTPTAYSFQRKTWYDGTYYWRSYNDPADQRIEFEYSTDGSSWTENTAARIDVNTNDFSIQADSSNGFIAYTNGYDIETRKAASYPATNFSWGSENVVYNGSSSTDYYQYPTLAHDSNSKVWTTASYYSTGTINKQIASADDDGLSAAADSTWYTTGDNENDPPYSSTSAIAVGGTEVDDDPVTTGFRFTNINIPQGAIINSATLDFKEAYGSSYGTTVKNRIYAAAEDNCSLGSGNIPSSKSKTTAYDDWDSNGSQGTYGQWYQASATVPPPDISGQINEVTNRSGWENGNSLCVLIEDDGSDTACWFSVAPYESGAANAAKLDISYTAHQIVTAQSSSANDISSWNSTSILDSSENSNKYGVTVPRTSGAMQAIWIDATEIESKNYNGSSWDANPTAIDNGVSDLETSLSAVSDASGNVHLVYIDSNDNTIYREYTSSWQTALTLDSNSGNYYPTISLNTGNGDLYAFWVRGDDIYYKVGASPYTSGSWDVSATPWQESDTNTYVSAGQEDGGNNVFAQWYDGDSVEWAKLSLNTAPNSPSSLTQKTTTDDVLATGDWHNITSIKFTTQAEDTDSSDTLYLCVETDLLGTSFSNTEDSCGSGVAYSGTPVAVSVTITSQADASEYHWQARVKDEAGEYSAWVSYDVNAESARDYGLDTTAPTGGTVYDGTSPGADANFSDTSLSQLSANWDSFNFDVSGAHATNTYDYSIGTSAGATDIKTWTDNGATTSMTSSGLTLQTSKLYYVNVRAKDQAGNTSEVVSSNGQLVAPSISFTVGPSTLTFDNLNPTNSYTDSQNTTLSTWTNAYGGYLIRAFVTDYLRSTDGAVVIADFTGGTYASPAPWGGSDTGLGYTSSDSSIQGSDKFGSGTLYAPFNHNSPGDIVADHTANVTGSPIINEQFTIINNIKTSATQAAHGYSTTVIYTVTAEY